MTEDLRKKYLLTGESYKSGLRDGRVVYNHRGEIIDDVTQDPTLRNGINSIAQFYEWQRADENLDLTTYADPKTGDYLPRSWMPMHTREDLRRRRELNRAVTYQTWGVFGRPPDYGSFNALGLLSVADRIGCVNPAWAKNIDKYIRWGAEHNAISADVIADVQSDRRTPRGEKPGRLRVVEERPDGIVVFGAKAANSVAVQGHTGTIMTLLSPGIDPDSILYCAIPINAPGVTAVLRPPTIYESDDVWEHPLDSRGEEADSLLIYDHVFVPNEMVFCRGMTELAPLYQEIGGLALWHILSRIAFKAELFAGVGQVIADVLGTNTIPQVRDHISEIVAYSSTLKAHVLASEDTAYHSNGVLVPNPEYITTGRLHSVLHYPRIVQILREISGQGMISRFSKAQLDVKYLNDLIEEFMPGTGYSANAKFHLFNLVWDLTSGANAMRVALFENVNSTPAGAMRAQIYGAEYRREWTDHVRDFLGLAEGN